MESIFRFFVYNWKFSILTTVFVAILGLLGIGLLQRETFPPVNFARVQITTIYPGSSPEEVQDKVTQIIEDELRGIEGIKDVRSISQNERSEISVRIDIDEGDPEKAVNEIQRAVQRASSKLPAAIPEAPLVTELKAEEIPILELAVIGPNDDRRRDTLVDRLQEVMEDVRGVAGVRLAGYRERELQVLLDRRKLAAYSVGITEVIQALSTRITNIPAGYVGDERINLVRVMGQVSDPKEVEKLTVRVNDSGQTIRVGDVGRVQEGMADPKVIARVNGEEATLLVTTKKKDADALRVIAALRKEIAKTEEKLPDGYKIVVYNDEASRISNRLDIVSFNAVAGLAVVLLVLFALLPGKIGLTSALSLPLSALGTIAILVYMGGNFNIITMLALIICLGNLVDNSVVISEHYTSLREQGHLGREAAILSARQFWVPFTASTVTIIAAFLPMIVTKGVLGQFIYWIPVVVTIALTFSLVEALTLLPARLQFVDARSTASGSSHWFSSLENLFGRFIARSLRHRYLTMFSLTGLIISGFVSTALFNRFELFPAEGVEFYIGRFEAPPETSIAATDSAAKKVSDDILNALGSDKISYVVARSGVQSGGPGDQQAKNGENVGVFIVAIKREAAANMSVSETLKTLRSIPKPDSLSRLTFESQAGGPPVGKPLTTSFRSSNYEQLRSLATAFIREVEKIPGVQNVEDDETNLGSEYRLVLNDTNTVYSGLNVDAVGLNLRTALEGTTVAKLTDVGTEYDVVVKFDESDRRSIGQLEGTGLLNRQGLLVPLKSIGKFESSDAPKIRKNYDFLRSITVTADVESTKITSAELNSKARTILEDLKKIAPDVSVSFGGEEESTRESLQSLGIALVLAIFGIFATLVFTFSSFSLPLLILSTIPLGLIGVLYAFILDQRPLSFLAFIGVIGLSGVVINSAIILVDYIAELRKERTDLNLPDLLCLASSRRLRAVVATGLTTVVGLIPTAFGLGGYDPILVPMTLALSWGMIVGTILSLVWIPSAYLVLEDLKGLGRRLFGRSSATRQSSESRERGLADEVNA